MNSMKNRKRRLYLITEDYPNQGGDNVFVRPELPELMNKFNVAVVCVGGKRNCTDLKEGMDYYFYEQKLTVTKKIMYVFRYPFCNACRTDLRDILEKKREKDKNSLFGRIRKSVEFYACAEEFYKFFMKYVVNGKMEEDAIYYTFWCNECSLPFVIHKNKFLGLKLVTRLHGHDLYEERWLYGRQPFKKVINAGLDQLFFIGQRPMHYYLKKHPELDKEKASVSKLGVFQVKTEPGCERKGFLLLSCSNVIPLKRVPLIIKALALMDEPIEWIHFGTGVDLPKVKDMAWELLEQKKNIRYTFKGFVENEQVRLFYAQNAVNCFITTSSTEGAPVSVMEALSAGVPVIGTAVGDIPDMIEGNGVLLPSNPKPEEIVAAIRKIFYCSEQDRRKMSEKSSQLWENNYDAEKNTKDFVEKLERVI